LKGRRTEIGEHKIRIRLVDEDDKELISGDGTVNFAEPPAGVLEISAGAILAFDIPFPKAGRYRFQIDVDEDLSTEIPITAALGPNPASRPPPEAL
jgi:hypothetical protein